jgi:hypothetical protein
MKALITTTLFLISVNALAYDMEDVRRILQQQEAEQNKQLLIQAKQLAKKKATEQSFDTQSPEQSTQTIAIRRVYDMQTGMSHKEVVRSEGQQTNTVVTQPHYNPQPGPYTQQGYNTQSAEQYAPNIDTRRGYDTQTNIPQR